MDLQRLIASVREAGVIGAGGAGFPTWRKLDCLGRVDTIILNGAECEPLLWADYHCLLHTAGKILDAALILKETLGVNEVILAVKKKRAEIIRAFAPPPAGYEFLRVLPLADVYPSGDEHILTFIATGRVVPQGGIPLDVGVLVQNVQTAAHILDAVRGRPVTRRFISVSGAVSSPLAVEAPIGIPAKFLLDLAGGATCSQPRILLGGVMMGRLVAEDYCLQKNNSAIVVLPSTNPAVAEHSHDLDRELTVSASVCDQCIACTELCPRRLLGHDIQPHLLMRRARRVFSQPGEEDYGAFYCCECGVCSLIACPVKITPRRLIAGMKAKIPTRFRKIGPAGSPHPDIGRKTLPMAYVKQRLVLTEYDQEISFRGVIAVVPRVRIDLTEFGGSLAVPAVALGQKVSAGEKIARGKWTDFHASISGRITAVNRCIEIKAE